MTEAFSEYPRDARIDVLILRAIERGPSRIAISGDLTLTYGELGDWSRSIARELVANGVQPRDVVALSLERGAEFAAAALATLRVGAAYVPVDPAFPINRIELLVADSGARALVTPGVVQSLAGTREKDRGERSLLADVQGAADWTACGAAALDPTATAYIMYTSGTTGIPKGVLVPHRAVVRLAFDRVHAAINADSVMAHIGAVGFDASVWELWATLIHGGRLEVLERSTVIDPELFRAELVGRGVTVGLVTSALFTHLAESDPTMFAGMRDLLVGGDVLSPTHARAVLAACPTLRLVNAYGPTENGVISTAHTVTVEDTDGRIPIGRSISATEVFVVSDEGTLRPVGEPGELWVAGDGLAIGYHRRPELTAEAFRDAPFAPGTRAYRTGDRVVQRADGVIEYVGRTDSQLKVRGQRIELGEIEHALIGADGVSEAVVLADRSEPGDPVLRAYLTGSADQRRIAVWLSERLPEAMLPSSFTVLPRFPITETGKIDRLSLAALPRHEPRDDEAPARPLDPIDSAVVGVWSDVLGFPTVHPHDTVRSLGGGSLAAARIAGRLQARLGRPCRVLWVLEQDAIGLGDLIRNSESAVPVVGLEASPDALLPLTTQQGAVFVEAMLGPDDLQYNLPTIVDLPSDIGEAPLRSMLSQIAGRHGALRARIFADSSGRAVQRVETDATVALDRVERPDDDVLEAVRGWVRPFDLGAGPVWRALLVRGASRTAIAIDVHHIVADGWSLRLVFDDLAALIAGRTLPVKSDSYGRAVQQLTSSSRSLPAHPAVRSPVQPNALPDLPLDRPREARRSTPGIWLRLTIDEDISASIRACATGLDTSPYAVCFAALAIVLGRLTGSTRSRIAVPFSGRVYADVEQTVGMFVTTQLVEVEGTPSDPFAAIVQRVAIDAAVQADLPQRSLATDAPVRLDRHALADVLFAYQDTGLHQVAVANARPRWIPEVTNAVQFDLALHIEPGESTFEVLWGYASALFEEETVLSIHRQWRDFLISATADPTALIASLGVTTSAAEPVPIFTFDL